MPESQTPAEQSSWFVIGRRAIEDPDFRERLIHDPRSTITESTGHEVPDDVEIVVVENGPKTFHIVLPGSDLDLSEIEVSGGWACSWACMPGSPCWNTTGGCV